ncbi:MAG: hypothetical protein ACFFD8_10680 [Candidatus Thorarchaeota archaeon]
MIEVEVKNAGTETINDLWLDMDLFHRLTVMDDGEELATIPLLSPRVLYTLSIPRPLDNVEVNVRAKSLSTTNQALLWVDWTPSGGLKERLSNNVEVMETEYTVKTIYEGRLNSSGTLEIVGSVRGSGLPGYVQLNTDWAVVSGTHRVEATKTPILPEGATKHGGIDFGSQQDLDLEPGTSRIFATSYAYTNSIAYGFGYCYGSYFWDIAVWKDGYPGKIGASEIVRTQKNLTIPKIIDMVVSIEWKINFDDTGEMGPIFVNQLESGFRKASNHLFDATDGQMVFGKIITYDDKVNWDDCDLRIHEEMAADSVEDEAWPKTSPSLEWEWPPIIMRIEMGRKRIQNGRTIFDSWDQDEQNADRPAYYSLIHELGHSGLGLADEYLSNPILFKLEEITKMIIDEDLGDAECGASLMFNSDLSEFCNPVNHDLDKDTYQELLYHESCWSRIWETFPWIYVPMTVNEGPHDDVGSDLDFRWQDIDQRDSEFLRRLRMNVYLLALLNILGIPLTILFLPFEIVFAFQELFEWLKFFRP